MRTLFSRLSAVGTKRLTWKLFEMIALFVDWNVSFANSGRNRSGGVRWRPFEKDRNYSKGWSTQFSDSKGFSSSANGDSKWKWLPQRPVRSQKNVCHSVRFSILIDHYNQRVRWDFVLLLRSTPSEKAFFLTTQKSSKESSCVSLSSNWRSFRIQSHHNLELVSLPLRSANGAVWTEFSFTRPIRAQPDHCHRKNFKLHSSR